VSTLQLLRKLRKSKEQLINGIVPRGDMVESTKIVIEALIPIKLSLISQYKLQIHQTKMTCFMRCDVMIYIAKLVFRLI
jgi:hypothetical protein